MQNQCATFLEKLECYKVVNNCNHGNLTAYNLLVLLESDKSCILVKVKIMEENEKRLRQGVLVSCPNVFLSLWYFVSLVPTPF